ncbi:hypothetical protein [Roseomonas sp. AR75]|uniref:hypothetical protein n=1 Tax=Roseomonas sp. AR75 TaxID=2562311 RepID=UPI0010BFCC59|nr:hypothetical protein [Roseomonas sp. AR75]
MRTPFRNAAWWWLAALLGSAMVTASFTLKTGGEDYTVIALAAIGMPLVAFGIVMGIVSTLSGLGAWRLARGRGMMARWQVEPAAWDAFRAFAARCAAAPGGLPDHATLQPATAPVEVRFGRHQAMVNGSYHPLRRFSIPEMLGLRWLQPPGAPECMEFLLVYPRGRFGGTISMALRVPVAPTARADAVRVFEHFSAMAPKPRIGLAQRRPWLVIGWGLAFTAACGAIALAAWMVEQAGNRSDAVAITLICALLFAIGGAMFTAIVAMVVLPAPRNGRTGPDQP